MREGYNACLGDLLTFQRGISWSAEQEYDRPGPGRYPVLRIPNVQAALDVDDLVYIRPAGPVPEKWHARAESIVMVGSNGNAGRVGNAAYLSDDDEYLFASFLIGARARLGAHPRFAYHLVRSDAVQDMISRSVQGSTGLSNLSLRFLENIPVSAPSIDEQQRIADVLDTLDELITRTGRVMAKFAAVYRGLVSALVEEPAAQSNGWKLTPLVDIVDRSRGITYGIVQPGPRQKEGDGIPIIRGQDYSNSIARTSGLYWVLPEIAAPYSRANLRAGDLLLSIVGVYVGTVGQVPPTLDGANITQTTARIAVRAPFSARFFFHQLIGARFQGEVRRYTKGSAQPGLNLADVERMLLFVPSPEQQVQVAAVLDESLASIGTARTELAKLGALRSGLADAVLTGRVRTVPR